MPFEYAHQNGNGVGGMEWGLNYQSHTVTLVLDVFSAVCVCVCVCTDAMLCQRLACLYDLSTEVSATNKHVSCRTLLFVK